MTYKYEIRSGRRIVSVQYSVSPLQAAVDYVRSFGTSDAEIKRVGVDVVAWRGARFTAVQVPDERRAPKKAAPAPLLPPLSPPTAA
jgi:hypothetical protein